MMRFWYRWVSFMPWASTCALIAQWSKFSWEPGQPQASMTSLRDVGDWDWKETEACAVSATPEAPCATMNAFISTVPSTNTTCM